MPDPTPANYRTAFGLLSHLFATPTLVALIQGRVLDTPTAFSIVEARPVLSGHFY